MKSFLNKWIKKTKGNFFVQELQKKKEVKFMEKSRDIKQKRRTLFRRELSGDNDNRKNVYKQQLAAPKSFYLFPSENQIYSFSYQHTISTPKNPAPQTVLLLWASYLVPTVWTSVNSKTISDEFFFGQKLVPMM